MKFISILSAIISLGIGSQAQPVDSLRQVIDVSLQKMEENSLHRKDINWKEFREKVYARTRGIDDLDSLLNEFPVLFEWLNDFHGAVATPERWISWQKGRPKQMISPELKAALDKAPRLKTERWGDIGYFRMPPVSAAGDQIPVWTQRLVDSLCNTDPSTVKGWIIDLRLNTGGNVWPMLASLGSLIGDGPIGGVRFIDGRESSVSHIKGGKPFGNGQYYNIPVNKCRLPASELPVVVLSGPSTGSSGEALLLAFKGRPNTVIIGEATAGFVTSNSSYELIPKKAELILATGYMMDRDGKYYTRGIEPDILINGGDDFCNLQQDKKIVRAKEWLKSKVRQRPGSIEKRKVLTQ